MKFSRKRMLDSFEEVEMNMTGNLKNMKNYHNLSDEELAQEHQECFDAMYDDDFNYGYEYDQKGNKVCL